MSIQEKNLTLPLTTKWFEMTKSGVKTEDYREITERYCKRLFRFPDEVEHGVFMEMISDIQNFTTKPRHRSITELMSYYEARFTHFDNNIMTLGYPSREDNSRRLKYVHKGIEIRTGNPEWGAEVGKLYFVIMHGERI